jgi:outer membrane protein OmpA-like peptidoglycan-associated protein
MKTIIGLLLGLVLSGLSESSYLYAQKDQHKKPEVPFLFAQADKNGSSVINAEVHFDFGSYDLKQDAKDLLDHLRMSIPAGKSTEVYVYGHTDWVGGFAYNEWLGQKRAEQVKDYLESIGIKATVVTQSYGKTKPVANNEYATGRQRNRRVEVEFCIINLPGTNELTDAGKTGTIPDVKKITDTTLVYAQGSQVHLTADVVTPYDLKDVKLEVKEIYTPEDMIENKATTQDKDGNSLISGGMVLIKATVNGTEITAGAPYTVNLPVEEYAMDSELQLYTSVKKGGHLVWKLSSIPVKIVKINDKYFYQFTVNTFGGFNCDKFRLADKDLKIKAQKYNIIETYIVDKKTKSLYYSHKIKGKYAYFKYRSITFPGFRLIVSAKRGKQYYYANVPLSALEHPIFSSRYIVNKDLFRPVTKKQLDKLFASR